MCILVQRYFSNEEELFKNYSYSFDNIHFGSDSLDLDFCTALGELTNADIPEEAKEKIKGGNAISILKKLGRDIRDLI